MTVCVVPSFNSCFTTIVSVKWPFIPKLIAVYFIWCTNVSWTWEQTKQQHQEHFRRAVLVHLKSNWERNFLAVWHQTNQAQDFMISVTLYDSRYVIINLTVQLVSLLIYKLSWKYLLQENHGFISLSIKSKVVEAISVMCMHD